MFGQVDSQWLVLALNRNDEVRQALTGLFLDIFVGVFLDDTAEQVDSFLNVRVVQFLQLLYEHIQHRNGNLCLFSLMGIYILIFLILFIFLLQSTVNQCDFFADYVFNQYE